MPFTFSHPAAVLPLTFIKKKWISVTALIIGSITPDFEYFFRMEQNSYYSHSWGGIFWFDLPLALLLVYLFNDLIKKELIENLPQFLNVRFSQFRLVQRNLNNIKDFIIVLISLLIGIISHVIWDKVTHKSVSLIDQQEHYTVFWEANSVAGAILIAAAVWKMRRGMSTQKSNIYKYWLVIFIIMVTVMYVRYLSTSGIREIGISAIVGFFTGLIITSLIRKLKNPSQTAVSPKQRMTDKEIVN